MQGRMAQNCRVDFGGGGGKKNHMRLRLSGGAAHRKKEDVNKRDIQSNQQYDHTATKNSNNWQGLLFSE